MARDFEAGSTEKITFADPNVGTDAAQTCALWVKLESNSDNTFLSYGDATGQRGFSYGVNSSNKLRVRLYIAGGGVDQSDSASTVSTGSWMHVAFTRNQASFSTMRHYINGAQDTTTSNDDPAGAQNSGDDFILGYKSPGDASGFGYFDGVSAEIAFWNVELSAAEIAALQYTCPLKIQRTNLKFYAPLWGVHSSEPDFVQHILGTHVGTVYADHPPIAPATRTRRAFFEEIAAAGATKIIAEKFGLSPLTGIY